MNVLMALILLCCFTASSAAEEPTQTITIGVEPFATSTVIENIISGIVREANHADVHNVSFIHTHSIQELKDQLGGDELSIFYGHPGYANYLIDDFAFVPILAINFNSPAIIVTSTGHPANLKDKNINTTVFTLEDHDIFTFMGKKHLGDGSNINYEEFGGVEDIILSVLDNRLAAGILSQQDLVLAIPQVRKAIQILEETEPVRFSYVLLNPRRIGDIAEIRKIQDLLYGIHQVLARDKVSYFYSVPVSRVTQEHIDDIKSHSEFNSAFRTYLD